MTVATRVHVGHRINHHSNRIEILPAALQNAPLPSAPPAAGSEAYAALLHAVFDRLPDGVVIAGTSSALLFCNQTARRIGGFESDEAVAAWAAGQGCYLPDGTTAMPPEEFPLTRALGGTAAENVDLIVRNARHPRGRRIRISAWPWREAAGSILGAVAVFRDVEESDPPPPLERLWSAVRHTADAVVMTDLDGTIVYVNPAFEQITGYSSREAIGATPRILKSGIHDRAFYEAMWGAVRSGSVFRGVLVNRRKDGELFHADHTITPVRRADGSMSHYVSVMRDITERRRAVERETEIRIARDVQRRLYPAAPARVEGYDLAGAIYPANTMCGDFFDLFPMAGGATGIAIADVSGHSMGAALIMAQTRAYVRALAASYGDVNTVIAKVNDALVRDLAVEHFVTMIIARLDPCSRTFTYASGGHHDGLVIDARGNLRETLPSNGIALGFFAGRDYQTRPAVELRRGETLVLFTDGIIESEAPDGEQFGSARAAAAVAAAHTLPAAAIAETLYLAACAFSGNAPQADDMTVFVCKATGDCAA